MVNMPYLPSPVIQIVQSFQASHFLERLLETAGLENGCSYSQAPDSHMLTHAAFAEHPVGVSAADAGS
jgi:hypothetical protein